MPNDCRSARPRRPAALLRVFAAAVLLALAACAGRAIRPLPVATPIELPRYLGAWHVIANVPYFPERGRVASRQEYALRPDGRIAVRYVWRTGFAQPLQSADAVATVRPGSGNREWTVRFYRLIPTPHRILEVAPDYSWALVDNPGRELAWVLARTPVLDEALYRDLEQRLRGHGVDTDKVRRIPQVPAQVGALGFDEPADP